MLCSLKRSSWPSAPFLSILMHTKHLIIFSEYAKKKNQRCIHLLFKAKTSKNQKQKNHNTKNIQEKAWVFQEWCSSNTS